MVPLQPSLIDLKTLGATLDIIRLAGSKPTRALLARVRSAGSRHEDTVASTRTPTPGASASQKQNPVEKPPKRSKPYTCILVDC
jgi:hypothetical protein